MKKTAYGPDYSSLDASTDCVFRDVRERILSRCALTLAYFCSSSSDGRALLAVRGGQGWTNHYCDNLVQFPAKSIRPRRKCMASAYRNAIFGLLLLASVSHAQDA